MATIVELSTEPKYTIKAVASQTGIQPVTLRAWERRHEILIPYRGNNRYRLYSERDVAILRWIKYRVGEGLPISSAVNELRTMTSNSIWPEALPVAPVVVPEDDHQPASYYASELYQALIQMDEVRASDLLRDAHAVHDLMVVCEEIVAGAVAKIDQARYLNEISFGVERFASGYLRCKLLSLLQAYPLRQNAPLILLGCAPMDSQEHHILMLAILLRSKGYRVEYLGPDLLIEDLVDYAHYVLPSMVILSASNTDSAIETRRLSETLRQVHSRPVYGYFGKAFDMVDRLKPEIPGVWLAGNLERVLDQVKGLLSQTKK